MSQDVIHPGHRSKAAGGMASALRQPDRAHEAGTLGKDGRHDISQTFLYFSPIWLSSYFLLFLFLFASPPDFYSHTAW